MIDWGLTTLSGQ